MRPSGPLWKLVGLNIAIGQLGLFSAWAFDMHPAMAYVTGLMFGIGIAILSFLWRVE